MYHTNAGFNRYGGFNRREHIVKFKIRDKTSSPSIIGITKAQPVTSCSSSSSSNSSLDLNIKSPPLTTNTTITSSSLPPKSPEHDTIFDFPDTEETLEVKLMVAAGRAIPEHHKKPTTNKKSSTTKKKISPVNTPKKSLSLNTTTTTTNTKKSSALKKKTNKQKQSHNEHTMLNRPPPQQQQLHKSIPRRLVPPQPPKQDFLLQQQQLLQQRLVQQQFMQQQQYLFQEQQQLLQAQQHQHQQLLLFQAQQQQQQQSYQAHQQQQQQLLQAQQQHQLLQEQQESVFDIFDFDYNPTITTKHTSTINDSYGIGPSMNTTTPQQNFTFTSNLPPAPVPPPPPTTTYPFSYQNNTTSHLPSLVSSTSLLNKPQPQLEKKRKRNLVSHLKTARGETATKNTQTTKFDFLSDDDDDDAEEEKEQELIPIRSSIPILKERSPSPPELTYSERMELELESMTTDPPTIINEPKSKRAPYQPQNKMNVKFTFEKKIS